MYIGYFTGPVILRGSQKTHSHKQQTRAKVKHLTSLLMSRGGWILLKTALLIWELFFKSLKCSSGYSSSWFLKTCPGFYQGFISLACAVVADLSLKAGKVYSKIWRRQHWPRHICVYFHQKHREGQIPPDIPIHCQIQSCFVSIFVVFWADGRERAGRKLMSTRDLSSLTCQACQMKQTHSRPKSGQTALRICALFIAFNESIASAMWNLTIPSCSSENVYFCVWDLRADRWKNKNRKWTEFKVENVCYLIEKSKTTHELWDIQGLLCIKNPLHLPCFIFISWLTLNL